MNFVVKNHFVAVSYRTLNIFLESKSRINNFQSSSAFSWILMTFQLQVSESIEIENWSVCEKNDSKNVPNICEVSQLFFGNFTINFKWFSEFSNKKQWTIPKNCPMRAKTAYILHHTTGYTRYIRVLITDSQLLLHLIVWLFSLFFIITMVIILILNTLRRKNICNRLLQLTKSEHLIKLNKTHKKEVANGL